jgi:hypothetical protein
MICRPAPAQTMRWCPVHQQAWCQAWYEGPQWISLPWSKLWWALLWARAGRCEGLISVEQVACPQCHEEKL